MIIDTTYPRTFSLLIGGLLFLASLLGLWSLAPQKAHAQVPLSPLTVPTWEPNSYTNAVKEYGFDAVAKAAVQALGRALAEEMIRWALNGYQGDPLFVQNPRVFLGGVLAEEDNKYVEFLGNALMCSSFQLDIEIDIRRKIQDLTTRQRRGQEEILRATECTLDDLIPGGDLEDYFAEGGFAEYGGYAPMMRSLTSVPDNPVTAKFMAEALLESRRARAEAEANQEVDRGDGYISHKICAAFTPGGNCDLHEIQTPGKNIEASMQRIVDQLWEDISSADEWTEVVIAFASALSRATLSGQGLMGY